MYKKIIRPILFLLDAEIAHHLTFRMVHVLFSIPLVSFICRKIFSSNSNKTIELWGLQFKGKVGLAAGFDKNALLINEWENFGFSFIEVGTITPVAQSGNTKPRLFRLPKDEAIINRMGFNNDGALRIAQRLRNKQTNIIVGGNIGKNKQTANHEAEIDYVKCLEALHPYVDFFTVNVSSPNTPELRALQEKQNLVRIFTKLNEANSKFENKKPILLKIAPDLSLAELDEILEVVEQCSISGIIATNTTISREGLKTNAKRVDFIGAGGLSGKPLTKKSTEIIQYISNKTNKKLPIIASGGVFSVADAQEKIEAGASLVQVYSGFIYEGPHLVKELNSVL